MKPHHTELLAVHEFAAKNGLDGKEHEAAKGKEWRNRVLGLVVSRRNQRFELVGEVSAGGKGRDGVEGESVGEVKSEEDMPNGISKVS